MATIPAMGSAEDFAQIRESDRSWAYHNPQTAAGEWGTTHENQAARDRHVLLAEIDRLLAIETAATDYMRAKLNPLAETNGPRRALLDLLDAAKVLPGRAARRASTPAGHVLLDEPQRLGTCERCGMGNVEAGGVCSPAAEEPPR